MALLEQLVMTVEDGAAETFRAKTVACNPQPVAIEGLTYYDCEVIWDVPQEANLLEQGRTCAAIGPAGRIVQLPPVRCEKGR